MYRYRRPRSDYYFFIRYFASIKSNYFRYYSRQSVIIIIIYFYILKNLLDKIYVSFTNTKRSIFLYLVAREQRSHFARNAKTADRSVRGRYFSRLRVFKTRLIRFRDRGSPLYFSFVNYVITMSEITNVNQLFAVRRDLFKSAAYRRPDYNMSDSESVRIFNGPSTDTAVPKTIGIRKLRDTIFFIRAEIYGRKLLAESSNNNRLLVYKMRELLAFVRW